MRVNRTGGAAGKQPHGDGESSGGCGEVAMLTYGLSAK
jgi:hypothetical protein